MLTSRQFARHLRIDTERLRFLIDRGWIVPLEADGAQMFQDIDLARAALIADLAGDMGVNDEGIDLVLDLIDQLYSLRSALSALIEALEAQPRDIRSHVMKDAQKMTVPRRHGSRGGR